MQSDFDVDICNMRALHVGFSGVGFAQRVHEQGGFDSFFSGFRVLVPGKKKVSERLCSGRLRSVQGFHLTCHCKLWGRAAAREKTYSPHPNLSYRTESLITEGGSVIKLWGRGAARQKSLFTAPKP